MCSRQDRATYYIYRKKLTRPAIQLLLQPKNILKRSISRGSSHRDHLIVVGIAKRPDEINLIIASVSCGWRSSRAKIGTNCLKLYSKDNISKPFKFNYHISTVMFPAPLPNWRTEWAPRQWCQSHCCVKGPEIFICQFCITDRKDS